MLVFRLIVCKAFRTLVDNEPARPAGSIGENRVSVGDPAIADPLFVAGDLVTDDAAVLETGPPRSSAPRSLPASGSVAP